MKLNEQLTDLKLVPKKVFVFIFIRHNFFVVLYWKNCISRYSFYHFCFLFFHVKNFRGVLGKVPLKFHNLKNF